MSARPEVSRRTLLTGGAATAALAGVGVWAASGPTPSFAHGDRGPGNGRRVLIGYDSAYGSTGDVAVAIAEEFGAAGWRSEVRRVGEGIDLDRYQAAVLGAPVHRDAWKEEATAFLSGHADRLRQIPVALFLTSMSYGIDPDRARQDRAKRAILEQVARQAPSLTPIAMRPFGGFLDYGRMAPINGLVYRGFAGNDTSGDFRDFDAIRAWGADLAGQLRRKR